MKMLGITGSLRKNSCNKGLLVAATEVLPSDCQLEIFDLGVLPLYNQDHESPLPSVVEAFKKKVREADALLIATPEYNYSIPGVLKNAIDWGSRPHGDSAWNDKPLAIMGTSPALQGTSRAQYHLRQICVTLNMHPLNRPELMIGSYSELFDAQGKLVHEKTRQRLAECLRALVQWTQRLSAS